MGEAKRRKEVEKSTGKKLEPACERCEMCTEYTHNEPMIVVDDDGNEKEHLLCVKCEKIMIGHMEEYDRKMKSALLVPKGRRLLYRTGR